jgi:uncharacterized repeat protein (TIGR02059 family)
MTVVQAVHGDAVTLNAANTIGTYTAFAAGAKLEPTSAPADAQLRAHSGGYQILSATAAQKHVWANDSQSWTAVIATYKADIPAVTPGVFFNGATAAHTVDSDTQITATVPVGATTGLVSVVTPQGTAFSQANFVVGNIPPPPGDVTAPTFQSAIVQNVVLTLSYDEPLDPTSVPATSAFSVLVNGVANTVSSVGIIGSVVQLTLTNTTFSADTVTVAYTAPGSGKVRDLASNNAANLGAQSVTNASGSGATQDSYDVYISYYDSQSNKNILVFEASAITSRRMKYAIWDRASRSARIFCSSAANAETELEALAKKRPNLKSDLSIITIPE